MKLSSDDIQTFPDPRTFAANVLRQRRIDWGWSQETVALRCGWRKKKQYKIARLEQGKWLPSTYTEAEQIAKGYMLKPSITSVWYELLFGSPPQYLLAPGDLDFADDQLRLMRQMRITGRPELAVSIGNGCDTWLANKEQHVTETERPLIQEKRAWVQMEIAVSYKDFILSEHIRQYSEPLLLTVKHTAKQYDLAELNGLAVFQQGEVAYIAQNYRQAFGYLHRAENLTTSPEHKLLIASDQALISAYVGHLDDIKKAATKFLANLHRFENQTGFTDLPLVCDALQGLARALVMADRETEAEQTLTILNDYCVRKDRQGQPAPIRDVQRARAQVEFTGRFYPHLPQLIEQYGAEGRALAAAHHFDRHVNTFDRLFRQYL